MIRKRKSCLAIVVALLTVAGFASSAPASEANKPARIGPVVKIHRGEKCVEPTEEMRRNHMKKILHQRDETMHKGIRTTKHSLKNCVDCHADPATNSVLGQDGFCSSCHQYASVTIDCFSCHTDKRDKNAVAAVPATNAAKGAQP
ncbi:MAG: hypothetical protein HY082_10990 [Gammaproteobacteria bacterium]|nr:hypothetical protein [Gammaproteobacteria bacterium]